MVVPNCNVVLDIGPGLVTVVLQALTVLAASIAAYFARQSTVASAAAAKAVSDQRIADAKHELATGS